MSPSNIIEAGAAMCTRSVCRRITKEEADAFHAEGSVYLIAHFDPDGNLVRVVKMLKGSVFFDYEYTYYPMDGSRLPGFHEAAGSPCRNTTNAAGGPPAKPPFKAVHSRK